MNGFLDKIQKLDKDATLKAEKLERPYLDQSFEAITSLGSPQLNTIFVVGLVLLGSIQYSKIIATALVISSAIIYPMKMLIGRKRPEDSETHFLVPQSFPSGHSGTAFAVATTLTFLFGKAYFFLTLAGLVALSRVYLDDHYFTDVIAGSLLGLASGIVAIVLIA